MEKKTVDIFVVSHLDSLLDQVPKSDDLVLINLETLDIPEEFRGNHLAESRFFLSDLVEKSSAEIIGFASARWHERFPDLPSLDKMGALASTLNPNQYFAPMLSPVLSKRGLRTWIAMQDLEHPGMGTLLGEAFERESRKDPNQTVYGFSVMGGQIFIPRPEFLLLQEFVVRNLSAAYRQSGLFPPFRYACSTCGRVFDEGVGRWSNSRHLGFLSERFISLYFILRPDLLPMKVGTSSLQNLNSLSTKRFEYPSIVHVLFTKAMRLKNRFLGQCKGKH